MEAGVWLGWVILSPVVVVVLFFILIFLVKGLRRYQAGSPGLAKLGPVQGNTQESRVSISHSNLPQLRD